MRVVFDAEFDDLQATRLWVLVAIDVDTEKVHVFRYDKDPDWKELKEFSERVQVWIGANSVLFDARALSNLGILDLPVRYPEHIDLQVLSRLIHYGRKGGHSVEQYGTEYGIEKPKVIEYDNPDLIDTYEHRCIEDCRIQLRMWRDLARFTRDESWDKAVRVEHDTQLICQAMKDRGFAFDKETAEKILADIEADMAELNEIIHATIPPVCKAGKVKILRRKPDGSPYKRVTDWLGSEEWSFTDGAEVTPITYEPFNPASVIQRLDVLNAAGWKPTEKTKKHKEAERNRDYAKLAHFKKYGWKTSEENLATLPDDAPEGAKKLAEWYTLEGRRGDLVEWLSAYRPETGAIHGTIYHIGSWTHRKSHSNPNQGNIFGSFGPNDAKDRDNPSPVERVKLKYNNILRSCWVARPNHILVGTDAEGIQLRILAHAMEDIKYAEAVANGRKEDQTDVHNVNRRALGLGHITRDHAKTFIYAWLLGASVAKVKEILGCTTDNARYAVRTFLERLPALRRLKQERVPEYAKRGFFVGVDGRKVICRSQHLMLAGILQNGESCVMKHANVLWRKEADAEGIPYFQVDDVHDEWQTEVPIVSTLEWEETKDGRWVPFTAESKRLGEIQRESIERTGRELGILTPLAGTTDFGFNWYETH